MADESDDAQVKNSADDDVEMKSESVGQESQIGSSYMPSSQYSHYKMRRGLAKYIASSEELYTSAQHVRFEKFIKNYVQSEYSSIPLHTIRSYSLKLFNDMKRALIAELSGFDGTISISTNFWSRADGQVGYVCVTAHFIDSAWLLQRRILGFRMLEYPGNDNVIFQCIMDIVREYMIDDKILSITFDDVTGTDAIIDMFKSTLQPTCGGQIFYVRCLGRVVNSVVQEGLKLMEVHIEKIRGAILYIGSTSARQEEFAALCESRGLECRNLKTDFKTHWNSTFIMLNSCNGYYAAIRDYYNDKLKDDSLLSNNDWAMSNTFMTFLMVFRKAALMGSEVYAPTSSGVLFMLRYVCNCFAVNRVHMIPEFTAVYEAMQSRLESYCECMSPSFCLAAAMEPTLKQDGVDYYVNDISKNINMPGLKTDAKAVEDRLHDLYKGYELKFAQKEKIHF